MTLPAGEMQKITQDTNYSTEGIRYLLRMLITLYRRVDAAKCILLKMLISPQEEQAVYTYNLYNPSR